MKKGKVCLLLSLICLAVGCASNNQLYTWEKYPTTLYHYKKEPSEENLQKHKEMIVSIMQTSEEKSLRVPPGVYCEYGFLLLKEGKPDDALKYFDLEEKTYPESGVFMRNLKSFIKSPVANETNNGSRDLGQKMTDIDKKGE